MLPTDDYPPRPSELPDQLQDDGTLVTQFGTTQWFKDCPPSPEIWELSLQIGRHPPEEMAKRVGRRPNNKSDRSRWTSVGMLKEAGFTVFGLHHDPEDPDHVSVALTKRLPWDEETGKAFATCFTVWSSQDAEGAAQ